MFSVIRPRISAARLASAATLRLFSTGSKAGKLSDNAPLLASYVEKVRAGEAPFTIPGHKRASHVIDPSGDLSLAVDGDVPLYGGLDTMKLGNKTLARAEKLYAEAYGADWARFSTGGATHANQAIMLATGRPGSKVLVSRIVHRSVLTGLILSGHEPVWIQPRLHSKVGLPLGSMHPDDVEKALAADPDIRHVIAVEPSYMGTLQDVQELARVVHRHGASLMVDQAWAAHFGWHPDLPPHAIAQGADAMVMSVHKALAGYTAAAVAVAKTQHGFEVGRLEQSFEATHTTSPPGATLASIDAMRALMVSEEGPRAMGRLIDLVAKARQRLAAAGVPTLSGADFTGAEAEGTTFDPVKLVMTTKSLGVSGVEVEKALIEKGVPVECADKDYIVAMVSLCDTEASMNRLVDEVIAATRGSTPDESATKENDGAAMTATWEAYSIPQRVVGLRDAFFSPVETVTAAEAVGRASADLVAPYPPGVAVLAPGELITAEMVSSLQAAVDAGLRVAYASDATLKTYRVLKLD